MSTLRSGKVICPICGDKEVIIAVAGATLI